MARPGGDRAAETPLTMHAAPQRLAPAAWMREGPSHFCAISRFSIVVTRKPSKYLLYYQGVDSND